MPVLASVMDTLNAVGIWLVPVTILAALITIGVAVRAWISRILARRVDIALGRLHIHPEELEPVIDTSEFDNDVRKGIVQIFERFTTNAIVFMGYYDSHSKMEPIVFADRVSRSENKRLLKDVADKDANTVYQEFTGGIHETVDDLNSRFRVLNQGELMRTIFDVERGGLLYYRISQSDYLIGICLDQQLIYQTDREMKKTAAVVQAYLGYNVTW